MTSVPHRIQLLSLEHASDVASPVQPVNDDWLAPVVPLRRVVPVAQGAIFGLPVEVRVHDTPDRAGVALHKLHDAAERHLNSADDMTPILALALGADDLLEHLGADGVRNITISIGAPLRQGDASATVAMDKATESIVIVKREGHAVCAAIAPIATGGVVPASANTAAQSIRNAQALAAIAALVQ